METQTCHCCGGSENARRLSVRSVPLYGLQPGPASLSGKQAAPMRVCPACSRQLEAIKMEVWGIARRCGLAPEQQPQCMALEAIIWHWAHDVAHARRTQEGGEGR
jgi:hypothetical protein